MNIKSSNSADVLAPSHFHAHIGLTWGGVADKKTPTFRQAVSFASRNGLPVSA
jgi:hypothetical protein